MPSAILQAQALAELEATTQESSRALQTFTNSFDSAMARFNNFEANVLPPADFGAEDLAIIAGQRAGSIAASIAALESRLALLQAL